MPFDLGFSKYSSSTATFLGTLYIHSHISFWVYNTSFLSSFFFLFMPSYYLIVMPALNYFILTYLKDRGRTEISTTEGL